MAASRALARLGVPTVDLTEPLLHGVTDYAGRYGLATILELRALETIPGLEKLAAGDNRLGATSFADDIVWADELLTGRIRTTIAALRRLTTNPPRAASSSQPPVTRVKTDRGLQFSLSAPLAAGLVKLMKPGVPEKLLDHLPAGAREGIHSVSRDVLNRATGRLAASADRRPAPAPDRDRADSRKRASPIGVRCVGSPAIKGDETVGDFQQFVTDVTSRLSTMSKGVVRRR
ncbi:hypothetical protein GCM10027614_79010 [Micromonospora vulcania]